MDDVAVRTDGRAPGSRRRQISYDRAVAQFGGPGRHTDPAKMAEWLAEAALGFDRTAGALDWLRPVVMVRRYRGWAKRSSFEVPMSGKRAIAMRISPRGGGGREMAALLAMAMTAATGSVAASSTPSTATPADEPTELVVTEPRECRRLTDFTAEDGGRWFVVNDGVMGGRSDGGGFIDDSVLRFEGSVVTAGGGFTSARLRLEGDELADSTRIEMRVRPDGRTYGVTLEDAAEFRGRFVSHRADFDIGPVDDEGWAIASVDYDQLVPSVFGVLVDAPLFDPATAREFGIIIADGIDGDFVLDIDWIDACP